MTDRISKEHRSWNMSRIKSSDTKLEIAIRSFLHKRGYRFRLNGRVSKKYHSKGVLPGKPDIVFARYKTVVFVHGCFWHQHPGCKKAAIPKSNRGFWKKKLLRNVQRDKESIRFLQNEGWQVLTVWECQFKKSRKRIINKICIKLL